MTKLLRIRTRAVPCPPIISDPVQVMVDDDEQIVAVEYQAGTGLRSAYYLVVTVSEAE